MPTQSTTRTCPWCGRDFPIPRKRPLQRYCSRRCRNESCPAQTAEQIEARFWAKLALGDDCWPWLGHLDNHGYGRFRLRGGSMLVHRYAYALEHGVLPDLVCHRCDNRRCCRADHLFACTPALNSADMKAKGRATHGERNGRAKLSHADVDLLRALYARGSVRQVDLAARFGIDQTSVSDIVTGRTWQP